jgi:hypothetical protein
MPPIPGFDRKLTRRSMFFGASASLLFAPAIVRARNLMPVRKLILPNKLMSAGLCERLFYRSLDNDLRTGRMRTIHNGKIVTVGEALTLTEHARVQGWLPGCSQLQS